MTSADNIREGQKDFTLNTTWGPLSAGTRVRLVDPNNEGIKALADTHGYSFVYLPFRSQKFSAQNPDLKDNFSIETNYLTPVRSRATVVPVKNSRTRRREKKAYARTQAQQGIQSPGSN